MASPAASANARVSYDLRGGWPTVGLAAAVLDRRTTSFAYTDTLYMGAAPGSPTTPGGGYAWRSQLSPERTDIQTNLRLALTGEVPGARALKYRLVGDYLFSPWEPINFGPTPGGQYPALAAIPGHPGFAGGEPPAATGQLFPVTRLTLFAGLEATLD